MTTNALLLLCGVAAIFFFWSMTREKKQQANAIEGLVFPDSWRVSKSEPLQVGGTIDILASGPEGHCYAIQVKPYKHVRYTKNFFGEYLELSDGRKIKPCPLEETLANGEVSAATPVLWLPFVKKERPKRSKKGVLIVTGDKKQLFKALKVA